MLEVLPSAAIGPRLSPNAARAWLFVLALVAIGLVWVALGITDPARRAGPSDLDTYERVVAALKAGQAYYPALHQALLEGGYGTLSPLNWRPPPFLTFLSWFPSLASAQVFLGLVTLVGWLVAIAYAYRRGGIGASAAAAFLMAASLVSIVAYRAELSFELCCGTLILISVCAYGLGWRWVGFVVAVLALFVRELAAIYVLVCIIMAIRDRRWTEAGAWLAAILVYAGFYLWHWMQLSALLGPVDHAAAVGWLQFGGLVFMLRTAAFNGVLLAAPVWIAALVLLLGLTGLSTMPRAFATVLLYLALYLFYGRPENEYWGAVYTPLVALGLVWSWPVLVSIGARLRRSS